MVAQNSMLLYMTVLVLDGSSELDAPQHDGALVLDGSSELDAPLHDGALVLDGSSELDAHV